MRDTRISTGNYILAGAIALLSFVMAAGLVMGYTKFEQYLRYKGIDDCARISRYEARVGENATVWYPDAGVYKSCLDDKGIE